MLSPHSSQNMYSYQWNCFISKLRQILIWPFSLTADRCITVIRLTLQIFCTPKWVTGSIWLACIPSCAGGNFCPPYGNTQCFIIWTISDLVVCCNAQFSYTFPLVDLGINFILVYLHHPLYVCGLNAETAYDIPSWNLRCWWSLQGCQRLAPFTIQNRLECNILGGFISPPEYPTRSTV